MYAGYKKETKNIEAVKDMIVERHRAGVCDSDGSSIQTDSGRTVAKPRGGHVTFRKSYTWDQGAT